MSNKIGRSVARPEKTEDQLPIPMSSPKFKQKYPSLYGFIANTRENENFHDRGCITLFYEDQVFKVSLNDRPLGRSTFVSHHELGVAFEICDRGLRSGTLKWRKNKRYAAQARTLFK